MTTPISNSTAAALSAARIIRTAFEHVSVVCEFSETEHDSNNQQLLAGFAETNIECLEKSITLLQQLKAKFEPAKPTEPAKKGVKRSRNAQ